MDELDLLVQCHLLYYEVSPLVRRLGLILPALLRGLW